tara:strand:+ start:246 stop:809 length:564 start_codon:yes stop_codon:yes gene_type:complete
VLKDRIQEIFEFTKSESPYRKANKGWINKDIFLDLSPSNDTFAQKNEVAKVTVFWSPLNTFLSNIFIIIMISSILVFTSLSFAKGRFNFNLFDTSLIQNIVKVEDNNDLKITQLKDLDSINSENEKNLEIDELDTTNNINSLDSTPINLENDSISTEIDKQVSLIKDKKNNIDNKNLENKKSKSNFI